MPESCFIFDNRPLDSMRLITLLILILLGVLVARVIYRITSSQHENDIGELYSYNLPNATDSHATYRVSKRDLDQLSRVEGRTSHDQFRIKRFHRNGLHSLS